MILIQYIFQHLRASWRYWCLLLSVSHCMTGLVQFHNCITRQIRKQTVRHWYSLCCIAWQPGLVSQVTVMQRSHSPRKTSLVVVIGIDMLVIDESQCRPNTTHSSIFQQKVGFLVWSWVFLSFWFRLEHFIAFQFVIRLCFLSSFMWHCQSLVHVTCFARQEISKHCVCICLCACLASMLQLI